jgi:hypothetical protein
MERRRGRSRGTKVLEQSGCGERGQKERGCEGSDADSIDSVLHSRR